MRFVITGEWRQHQLLRLVIVLFVFFVAAFWVTSALMYFDRMSLSYDSVVRHYLGERSQWGDPPVPRSYKVLLEVSHAHLFAMGILIMTMTHLVLFVPAPSALKAWLVILTFGSAFVSEGSGWLIRYLHPVFAYLKIAAFLAFQMSMGAIILLLLVTLFRRPPQEGAKPRQNGGCPAWMSGSR